jgi:hypothetical protein
VLVGENHVVAIGSADRGDRCKFKGLGIHIRSQGLVSESVDELTGENLVPDCARDGVAQCTADVVCGEVETGNDGKV